MTTFVNLEPCEIAVTAVRGDYVGFTVNIATGCEGEPVQLDQYNYSAELWSVTRCVDDNNPSGGLVPVEKQADFTIELNQASDPPMVVLSLLASQTEALQPDTIYHWDLKWFLNTESIKTIGHGPFKVIT